MMSREIDAKKILYAVLTKYYAQDATLDAVWQEVKEAGIFSDQGSNVMNYEQALERAKATPVMRAHWKRHWLTFENGQHLELHDDGSTHEWCPLRHDIAATDWVDAPQSQDQP